MIRRLQLRNFRAHKKLDIRFSKGVNSLIGKNAAGKSTILRSIWYASQNKPSGNSIIRWGAKKASVRITDERKNKVKRIRGKGVNLYKLNDKEFKAFGNKVPEEIQKCLGLSAINFQGQHDAPFWFSKTAGEVSRELNIIVNLDVIDSTLATVQSGITTTKHNIAITEKRRDNFKGEKDGLKYVKEMNTHLKRLESLEKKKSKNSSALARLEKLVKSGVTHAHIREIAAIRCTGAAIVQYKCLQVSNISEKVESLSKLVDEGAELLSIPKYKAPSFNKVKEAHCKANEIQTQRLVLEDLINNLTMKWEIICQQKRKVQTANEKLKKAMGKRCPLCTSKL